MGTIAKHYLEKLNFIVAYLSYPGPGGKIHDFMINVRAHLMSWPQRSVSMFVYISPYTAYEDMRFLQRKRLQTT